MRRKAVRTNAVAIGEFQVNFLDDDTVYVFYDTNDDRYIEFNGNFGDITEMPDNVSWTDDPISEKGTVGVLGLVCKDSEFHKLLLKVIRDNKVARAIQMVPCSVDREGDTDRAYDLRYMDGVFLV